MTTKNAIFSFALAVIGLPGFGANVVLDNFNSGFATGSVMPGIDWVGQVVQNPTSITIGGTAPIGTVGVGMMIVMA
jgi:hypothetical protein